MIRITHLRYGARRHPVLRLALGLIGLALLALLSVFALAVGAVVLIAWAIKRQLSARRSGRAEPMPAQSRAAGPHAVLEGEYRVVRPNNREWLPR